MTTPLVADFFLRFLQATAHDIEAIYTQILRHKPCRSPRWPPFNLPVLPPSLLPSLPPSLLPSFPPARLTASVTSFLKYLPNFNPCMRSGHRDASKGTTKSSGTVFPPFVELGAGQEGEGGREGGREESEPCYNFREKVASAETRSRPSLRTLDAQTRATSRLEPADRPHAPLHPTLPTPHGPRPPPLPVSSPPLPSPSRPLTYRCPRRHKNPSRECRSRFPSVPSRGLCRPSLAHLVLLFSFLPPLHDWLYISRTIRLGQDALSTRLPRTCWRCCRCCYNCCCVTPAIEKARCPRKIGPSPAN